MERKIRGFYVMTFLVLSLFLVASAMQIRPMNNANHVVLRGDASPYMPPAEGPNHGGPSHYTNKWMGVSKVCGSDFQTRPANLQTWFLKIILCE